MTEDEQAQLYADYQAWAESGNYRSIYANQPVRQGKTALMDLWEAWTESEEIQRLKVLDALEDQREREAIRIMNTLHDALARNGFWFDVQGIIHDSYRVRLP